MKDGDRREQGLPGESGATLIRGPLQEPIAGLEAVRAKAAIDATNDQESAAFLTSVCSRVIGDLAAAMVASGMPSPASRLEYHWLAMDEAAAQQLAMYPRSLDRAGLADPQAAWTALVYFDGEFRRTLRGDKQVGRTTVIYEVADTLQEFLIEEFNGVAIPACPLHGDPARPTEHGDIVQWECARDAELWSCEIGAYGS